MAPVWACRSRKRAAPPGDGPLATQEGFCEELAGARFRHVGSAAQDRGGAVLAGGAEGSCFRRLVSEDLADHTGTGTARTHLQE